MLKHTVLQQLRDSATMKGTTNIYKKEYTLLDRLTFEMKWLLMTVIQEKFATLVLHGTTVWHCFQKLSNEGKNIFV